MAVSPAQRVPGCWILCCARQWTCFPEVDQEDSCSTFWNFICAIVKLSFSMCWEWWNMFSFYLVELRPGFFNMCSDTGMAKRYSLSITVLNGHLTSSAYFFSCRLMHMIFHDMSIYFLKEVLRGTRELTVRCRIDSVSWVDLPQLWPCVEISLYPAWGVWGTARVKVHLGVGNLGWTL